MDMQQSERLKDTVRALESDENEARWEERVKKIADKKPAPERPA